MDQILNRWVRFAGGRSVWRARIYSPVFCLVTLWATGSTLTAQVELSGMQPSNCVALDGVSNVKPFLSKTTYKGKQVIQFAAESTITYPVPAGQNTFTGVLLFKNPPLIVQPQIDTEDRIRVRIYVDSTPKLDAVFDQASPPLYFSVPVQGASRMAIQVLDFFTPDKIYIAEARFSEAKVSESSSFSLPEQGSGAVVFEDPAQALMQKFVPGSVARFTATYAGHGGSASVTIDVRPEHGNGAPNSAVIPLHFAPGYGEVSTADGSWTVPRIFGPALLTISLKVAGTPVWSRTILAALSPQVNLATVQDSSFGVHISESGYLHAQDDFAYLWNAKWARIFIRWENIERSPGTFDFSATDELVNSYRAQHMKIMMVLGESWPQWTRGTGPQFQKAWAGFIQKAVDRYKGDVDAWEPFNEIDDKARRQPDPNWDIELLKSSMTEIRQLDPGKLIVCCSSSTGTELDYQERLLRNGVLSMANVLAIHPYQRSAPENKEGVTNLLGRIAALHDMAKSAGMDKPVWCTEAQWIMGPADNPVVTAPNIDDHTQAEYVVRANLLSVPESKYFLHMPFFYASHRAEHIDTLAAYSFMAYVLSDPRDARFLRLGPDLFAVVAGTSTGITSAFWTRTQKAAVSLSGIIGAQAFDMYGNSLSEPLSHIALGQEPVYVLGTKGIPVLNVEEAPLQRQFRTMAPAATWAVHRPGEQVNASAAGVDVQTPVEQYGYDLKSEPISVNPNTCYVVRIPLRLYRGSLMLLAVDSTSGAHRGISYISLRAGESEAPAELRFLSASSTHVNIVVGTANVPDPASSQFQVTGAIQVAPCREQH